MSKKADKKRSNKSGLSEIVAYSILIAIAIGLAVMVFGILQYIAKGTTPAIDCNEGTSVEILSYNCTGILFGGSEATNFTLYIKNNGRFNISGVIVKVSDDSSKEPVVMLNNSDSVKYGSAGNYQFDSALGPGGNDAAMFINSTTNSVSQIRRVSVQPYIFSNGKKVVCQGTVIKEPITGDGC